MSCFACPRRCGADRRSHFGLCKTGELFSVARIALHFWEEPPVSGTRGSGTVFFSGCNMNCVFCQNYEISATGKGAVLDGERLEKAILRLVEKGPHNINFVTPSHFALQLVPVLQRLREKTDIPFVYNSGGYDDVETLKKLEGLIDVYLPDFKYGSDALGEKYSGVKNYFTVAQAAIAEMRRQQPNDVFDSDGIMQKGVIVRHLVLPANVENSKSVLDKLKELDENIFVSLMGQYFPTGRAERFPELKRSLKKSEYERVRDYFFNLGLKNGFEQEPCDSVTEKGFVPQFADGEQEIFFD